MKRITSLLLALLLCLTLAPTIALPTAEAASGDVTINSTNFPDKTFRNYVKENFDTNGNGVLSASEIADAKVIYVSETSVTSLKGVEYLTALEELYCWDCQLTSLDVSKNTKLWDLECYNNQMTSLTVGQQANLIILEFWNNKVTKIDVSGCPELIDLGCGDNQITSVDISKNPKLYFLTCQNNKLSSLDLSNNAGLGQLVCYGNNISSLNITPCPFVVQAYKNPEEVTDEGTRIQYLGWNDEAREGWIQLYVDKATTVLTDVVAVPPTITAQPQSQTVGEGATVKFTVAANNATDYQWYYRTGSGEAWKQYDGGNSATLTLTAKLYRDGYQYRCKVSNSYGEKFSSTATLTVSPTPVVTTNPKSQSGAVGDTLKFTAKASGADLTYQWYYRTSSTGTWMKSTLTGNKTKTLTVPVIASRNGYQYKCRISNANGSVYSTAAKLTVNTTITSQPSDARVALGKTAKFTVKATGAGLTYQWYYKSPNGSWAKSTLSGNDTATLSVPVIASRNKYQYKCLIKDANGGKVYSNAVTLKVKTVITSQPTDQSAPEGSTAIFTVQASGLGLLYQWQYRTSSTGTWKDSKANGNKTDSLAVTARASYANFEHRCVITDANGAKTYSNIVKLTVTP
ncbi:MAG: immunoglobulin domain-containing protein [Oscillospiraceae bacterium]|nr:immunoglobulin domain-containing protein [Oscillospiraceae bacterium]